MSPGTDFTWMQEIRDLTPAALTVRAQTISPNDQDRLLWDAFLPRQDVDSTLLTDIFTLDDRYAADRREWNARGRAIPIRVPDTRQVQMTPIEAYFKVDELEIQKLLERSLGNDDIFRRIVQTNIPDRVDRIVSTLFRRIEFDFAQAWANGQIVSKNPQTGQTFTFSYGFSGTRYPTAGTAWNNGAVNAYTEFMAFLTAAMDRIGSVGGAVMRLATYNEIIADAPQGVNGIKLTRAQLLDRVQQDLGTGFTFYIVENSLDSFDDGGLTATRTKVWPAQKVAAVPAGSTAVGFTAFAPVARAMQISAQVPDAGIDIRGATVVHDASNGQRELTVEAQLNALPVPNEQLMYVINAGV